MVPETVDPRKSGHGDSILTPQLSWPALDSRLSPLRPRKVAVPNQFNNPLAALALIASLMLAPAAAAAGDITGYRSAAFGMSEAATRAAIEADFGIAANDIPSEIHDVEKTTALKFTVRGLVAGTGQAEISYLLGYQSRKLLQVTILWRATNDSAAAVGRLLLAA